MAAELERRWNRALELLAKAEREWVAFEAGERQKEAEDRPGCAPAAGGGSARRVARSRVGHAAQEAHRAPSSKRS